MKGLVVLIPVYKNQQGLEQSLQSLREARGDFDVVVVDDGSPEPITAPTKLRQGISVTVLRLDRNRGIAGALNQGLHYILAQGYRYVARLDSCDTVASERFQRQTHFLDSNPNCAAASSFVDFVDASRSISFRYRAPCEHAQIVQRLHLNNCLVHSGSMLRASALQAVGMYREDVLGAEDYELFLRMAQTFTLAVLPEVLTTCDYSTEGLTVTCRHHQQRARLKLQLRYFDPASPYSFYGVARTLLAMLVPHSIVFRFKRAYLR